MSNEDDIVEVSDESKKIATELVEIFLGKRNDFGTLAHVLCIFLFYLDEFTKRCGEYGFINYVIKSYKLFSTKQIN